MSQFSEALSNGIEPRMEYPNDLMQKFLDSCFQRSKIYQRIEYTSVFDYLKYVESTIKQSEKAHDKVQKNKVISITKDEVQPIGNEIASDKNEETWIEIDLHSSDEAEGTETERLRNQSDEAKGIETESLRNQSEATPRRKKSSFKKQIKKIFCCFCCCVCGKKD